MTTQHKPDFILHTDPGHGWLQVPIELARQAERESGFRLSTCSYQDETFAYLEEDCDAPAFMVAMGYAQFNSEGGWTYGDGINALPAKERRHNGDAPIRRKPEYTSYWHGTGQDGLNPMLTTQGRIPAKQMDYLRTERAKAMTKETTA